MSLKGILGLILLLVGIFVFVYGLNASNSLVEQLNNTFLGRFSETTTWYIIGGLALGRGWAFVDSCRVYEKTRMKASDHVSCRSVR